MEVIGTDFENWYPYLMKQFQLMYERGEKCDLEISCNKQIFLVHRVIMSACSDYVKELGDKQHIILPEEVSCKALKMVLDFVYSGKIVFSKEEKDDLLLASNLLNMRLLTELIKMEESCSFTLSMDDEPDEKSGENANVNNISQDISEADASETASQPQTPSQVNYKKKSDVKSNRSRSNKNSILPPLHKFPYLQQKFSASRTYGLITTLTEPIPSRFEIPESMMLEYRSSFEDVSYETERLCGDMESFPVLEQQHIQFLKKIRESSNHKRTYSNALYSPFDKYTPPYTVNNDNLSRKRELTSSYLSKSDPIPAKRNAPSTKTPEVPRYANKNVKNIPPAVTVSPPVSVPTPVTVVAPVNVVTPVNVTTPATNLPAANVLTSVNVEINHSPVVENANVSSDAALILELSDAACKNGVQEPPQEIIEVPSIENGEKVELIKLNNAVVTPIEDDYKTRSLSEEVPDVSISIIASENDTDRVEARDDVNNDVTLIDSSSTSDVNMSSVEEVNMANMNDAPTSQIYFNATESKSFPADDVPDNNPDPLGVTETTPSCDSSSTPCENVDSTNTSTDTNSQILAVKTKGTENPAQLSKLVEDLCKKSPLLKNKNVRFKIVPVKGPISDILKDQARVSSNILNKAIIVKKTENVPKPEAAKEADKPIKKSDNVKLPSIENINGPWDCKVCGVGENPMKFDTYFEFRTHLHEIHSEPNNPMFCIHCGYKSLKRNMQLYHLFIKHNVEPPSSFKFPKCDKCEFYALNEYYLQKHLACHPSGGMEYVCACKVAFKTSEALQKHIVSGDCKNTKSFTCGYCRGMFDRFVNLKAHMRVCMKERSKPTLQNNDITLENNARTISDGGKDYLAL